MKIGDVIFLDTSKYGGARIYFPNSKKIEVGILFNHWRVEDEIIWDFVHLPTGRISSLFSQEEINKAMIVF